MDPNQFTSNIYDQLLEAAGLSPQSASEGQRMTNQQQQQQRTQQRNQVAQNQAAQQREQQQQAAQQQQQQRRQQQAAQQQQQQQQQQQYQELQQYREEMQRRWQDMFRRLREQGQPVRPRDMLHALQREQLEEQQQYWQALQLRRQEALQASQQMLQRQYQEELQRLQQMLQRKHQQELQSLNSRMQQQQEQNLRSRHDSQRQWVGVGTRRRSASPARSSPTDQASQQHLSQRQPRVETAPPLRRSIPAPYGNAPSQSTPNQFSASADFSTPPISSLSETMRPSSVPAANASASAVPPPPRDLPKRSNGLDLLNNEPAASPRQILPNPAPSGPAESEIIREPVYENQGEAKKTGLGEYSYGSSPADEEPGMDQYHGMLGHLNAVLKIPQDWKGCTRWLWIKARWMVPGEDDLADGWAFQENVELGSSVAWALELQLRTLIRTG
ncbi:hypothetical protein IMSHALPRED_007141 [Imshaugia aleurites]|uniref:Uncharacterized protein n=1 Tax=Imshaugia aleurites TaxID=172621 RepID=A0A8H3FQG2_9LECA|nr:hypothetical protein IMSHALPRED_007141 [Imshaugia aleurites]